MKVMLEFNLDDVDDRRAYERANRAFEMANLLFDVNYNLRKTLSYSETENNTFMDGVDAALHYIRQKMEEEGINLDKITY